MGRKNVKMRLSGLAKVVLFVVAGMFAAQTNAQDLEHKDVPNLDGFREIYRDTTEYVAPTTLVVQRDTVVDPSRIVTNSFGKNWFWFATVGVHTFRGDYSKLGEFSGTVSPDFTVGIGKWFLPGLGLKAEFGYSNSRGYTIYEKAHYGYGDPILSDGHLGFQMDGSDDYYYRKMKTPWWDIHISAILNLSRLIAGYEGMGNTKMMNQFMLNLGVGLVHHTGYRKDYGSDNELSAHAELQYSRFFTSAKRVSLDIKARGIFYQTNFDHEYGQVNNAAHKVDCNLGLAVGFTFYLGSKKDNGWAAGATTVYQRDYRVRDVLVIKEKDAPVARKVEQGTMTFYVFYPNNYSGRNDAPIVSESDVNAMDYLAGGLYTQKRYTNTDAANARLNSGASLRGLATEDIPTEQAEHLTYAEYLPRGYEMLTTTPMSLSLSANDMQEFCEKEGFYYAPIDDGHHVWQYRIDDATQGQRLLSNENYAETQTFGINAHQGLDIIREHFNVEGDEELVSFADVYAAINGNEGYISQFTDAATVERIRDIFQNGVISVIQAEGMATSQDNYTGANAAQVGDERNNALSENRANAVVKWLQQNDNLEGALMHTYIGSANNQINTVTDESTRGLNAKLNRGVKVKIRYMIR